MDPVQKMSRFRISSPLLSGLVHALIWMIAGSIIVSLLLLWTDLQESRLAAYSFVIHGLAVLAGGLISGRRAGNKGWYHGGILGLSYCFVVMIVGFLAFDAGFNTTTPIMITLCFLLGALGGIVGVNSKK